jgi:hypoxanthine phosphoribosyltransferase
VLRQYTRNEAAFHRLHPALVIQVKELRCDALPGRVKYRQGEHAMKELHPDLVRVIISEEEIAHRVQQMADQISQDYRDVDHLYIIGILKGAFIFLADLTRRLEVPHVVDFMALSSYGKTTESGAVRILMDLREPIEGQHVLVVEDIVDTGHTLNYLVHILQGRNPASLRTCALVRKERDQDGMTVDYLGFNIPDVWVVGYGLDYADRFRTLPIVAELKRNA